MRRSCCHEACFLFCLVAALGYCTALLRCPSGGVQRPQTVKTCQRWRFFVRKLAGRRRRAMRVRAKAKGSRPGRVWRGRVLGSHVGTRPGKPCVGARLERPRVRSLLGPSSRFPRLRAHASGSSAPVEAVRSAPIAALPGCAFARASPRPDPAASGRCDSDSQPDPAARAPPRPDLAAARRQSGSHRLVAFGLQHICAAGSFACLSRLAKSLAVSWSPDEIMERWRVI